MRIKVLALASLVLAPQMALAQMDTRSACDFDKVQDFVDWFAGNADNQKAASEEPLDAAFMDVNEKGEWAPIASPHRHDELGWPILPPLAYLTDYKILFVEQPDGSVLLNTTGGLGVNITYTFRKQPCWTLVKLVDATR